MKGLWPGLSIPRKLTLSNIATSSLALLLASALFSYYDYVSFRAGMERAVETAAHIIAGNSTAALAFQDSQSANETLSTLAAEPYIEAACMYDERGRLFANYRLQGREAFPCPPTPSAESSRFVDGYLDQAHVIKHLGHAMGWLFLRAHLGALQARLIYNLSILGAILAISGLLIFLLSRRLQRGISEPLLSLAQTATRVSEEKDYSIREPRRSQDEIGVLVDRFNEMLERIQQRDGELQQARYGLEQKLVELRKAHQVREQLQQEVVSASRRAGMADVAASILHNIGNVLTSINVSTERTLTSVRRWPLDDISRVAGLLTAHAADAENYLAVDARGKRLPGYLTELGSHLMEQRERMMGELSSLERNVDHVKQIIGMQQGLAKTGGLEEPASLGEIMDHAVVINLASLERHEIDVIREYEELPKLMIDRHHVLQILVNLINNSKHAITAAASLEKERRILLSIQSVKGEGRVRMSVSDTGIGIPADRLERIFTQGFTTRADGHGLGLHSGALIAKQLGGLLRVESEGEGCGATLTLELPARYWEGA